MNIPFDRSPRSIDIGDIITVYTTGIGPGSQGFTGVVLQSDEHYLYLGLFPPGTPPVQSGTRNPKSVVAMAIIPFRHITTLIHRT